MPALGTQARMTVRGEKNPHTAFEDPLENRAWAVWFSVRNGKARVSGVPAKGPESKGLQDVDGFEVEVNMTNVTKNLWSEVQHMDPQSRQTFAAEIRQFLNVTGNAVNLRSPGIGSGDHGQPLWWIRETWNDAKAFPVVRKFEPTYTESRLTPQEAGEDRPPAPVETRRQDDANRTVVISNKDRVLELVEGLEEPVYQREVVQRLQINPVDAGRVLRELLKDGKVFRRYETTEERPAELEGRYRYLYWHSKDVPKRKTPLGLSTVAMDLVAKLKPGELLRVSWMTPEDKAEVQELVDNGLIVWDGEGVKLAPEKPVTVTAPKEALAGIQHVSPSLSLENANQVPVPARGIKDSLEAVTRSLADLIEAQVQASTDELRRQLTDEQAARRELEGKLIAARTELSTERKRTEKIRTALKELSD